MDRFDKQKQATSNKLPVFSSKKMNNNLLNLFRSEITTSIQLCTNTT